MSSKMAALVKIRPKPQPVEIEKLVNNVIIGAVDEMCALCMNEDTLFLPSLVLKLKDAYSDIKITVRGLLEDLQMVDICKELETFKICTACVTMMKNFFLFKRKCKSFSTSLNNFVHVLYSEITKFSLQGAPKKQKKSTLRLPYNKIIEYKNLKDAIDTHVDDSNCDECVQHISEYDNVIKARPELVHKCNICKITFTTHIKTIDHLMTKHTTAKLSVEGIIENGVNIFHCKICQARVPCEEYLEHLFVHKRERVTEMVLKNKLFCCCCLKESENLVNVFKNITEINSQTLREHTISLETLLSKVLKIDELNLCTTSLICEECINGAIEAHTFQETCNKSTQILLDCIDLLNQRLITDVDPNKTDGTLIVRVEYAKIGDNSLLPPTGDDYETLDNVSTKINNKPMLYECTVCGEYFGTRHEFRQHRNQIHKAGLHCQVCDEQFPTLRKFMKHKREHPNVVHCPLCRQVFKKTEIYHHFEREHGVQFMECDYCNKRFVSRAILKRHISGAHESASECEWCSKSHNNQKKHSCISTCLECTEYPCIHKEYLERLADAIDQESIFRCLHCNFRIDCTLFRPRFKRVVLEHANKEHLKHFVHKCDACDAQFPSEHILNKHKNEDCQSANSNKLLHKGKCSHCGVIVSKVYLHRHIKTQHGIETDSPYAKEYLCEICGKVCKRIPNLNLHMQSHKNYEKCPECLKFVHKRSIKKHMATNHRTEPVYNSTPRVAKCKNPEGRRPVLRTVRGERVVKFQKEFKCNECDYITISSDWLIHHTNKVHLKIKPYICTICKKGYHSSIILYNHKKIHTAEPRECEVCKKVFVSKKGLEYHLREHQNERPYSCDICGKTFVANMRVREHKVRRHMKPTHPCPVCGKLFTFPRFVRKHMRTHTGEKRVKKR